MSYWLDLLYLRHNVLTILSKPSTLAMSPVNVYSSCADLQDGLKISLADPDNRGVMEGRELVNPDVAITAPQTAEEDARRLMVLRSYNILESGVRVRRYYQASQENLQRFDCDCYSCGR
jgi:hypothetical protein